MLVCVCVYRDVMPQQQPPKPAVTTRSASVAAPDSTMPAWAAIFQQHISSLNDKMDRIATNIEQKITDILEPVASENSILRETVSNLSQKVRVQESQIDYLRTKHQSTLDRLIKLEAYGMR